MAQSLNQHRLQIPVFDPDRNDISAKAWMNLVDLGKAADGLWIGNHLKARNGLQRVGTIPGVRPGAVRTPGFLRGQTEFQSAWVHLAAWCRARRWV